MVASTVNNEPLYTLEKGKMVLNRKLFSQYTIEEREVKQMDDALFFDYANFLLRQQDVNATEDIKDAIETTKKAKDIKTYSEFVKVSQTVMTTLLIGGIVFLCIIIPVYAYVFRKDVVKSTINYQLFPLTFYLIVLFGFYVFLYLNMNTLVKKIMTLL
jgi:hypothetical protein